MSESTAPRRRAVGGEFEVDPALLAPYPSEPSLGRPGDPGAASDGFPRGFATARSALRAAFEAARATHGASHVLLPDYLCRSIVAAVHRAGCSHSYYPVDLRLQPDCPALEAALDAAPSRSTVLLIEYFGLADVSIATNRLLAHPASPVIVVDRAQSLLGMEPVPGATYTIASYRKTLPVPDGAWVLSTECVEPKTSDEAPFVPVDLVGRLLKGSLGIEALPDETYLEFGQLAEQMLDRSHYDDCEVSHISRRILRHIDLEDAATRRANNFDYLRELLEDLDIHPILERSADGVPLVLPVLLPDRDRVRRRLAEQRIFCPVHWPWPPERHGTLKPRHPQLWDQELSLLVDQRYGRSEMDRIADGLRASVREL